MISKSSTLIPISKQLLFFADAPIRNYPYRINTFKDKKKIRKNKASVKLAILDQGIYTHILTSEDKTYPKWLIDGMYKASEEIEENVLVSCCDFPGLSFEKGREHFIVDYDNVEDTIKHWKLFKKSKGRSRVIFTLQLTSNTNLKQINNDLCRYPEPASNFVGIGSLCRIMGSNKEKEFMTGVLRTVRNKFPNHFIHVWGASVFHLRALRNFADSFDNSKWTRPVNVKRLNANWGCKNKKERIRFFVEYLKKIYPNGMLDPSDVSLNVLSLCKGDLTNSRRI